MDDTMSIEEARQRHPDAWERLVNIAMPDHIEATGLQATLLPWMELASFEGETCLRMLLHDGSALVALHEPINGRIVH